MDLELTILGASSAIPLAHRYPTSQFLTLSNRHFLIDCGEGTQARLRQLRIGFSRINHIFISHLHGDHFFGLAPMLSTFNLLDRQKAMHIYAPKGLKEVVNAQIKLQGSWLKFPLIFHYLEFGDEKIIFEDEKVIVKSFPLDHGINCSGFLFQEKVLPRNIKKEALKKYNIPIAEIKAIKGGQDWKNENGDLIPNKQLTEDPPIPLSYAYCTDTRPCDNLKQFVDSPDLLYHEATFTEKHKKRAHKTMHSTAKQAAQVATDVKARNLLLGHYSARYDDLEELECEAREIYPFAQIAKESVTYRIKRSGQQLEVKEEHKKSTTI